MDDAWLIDTGDWRQPSIVVLQSTQPKSMIAQLHCTIELVQDHPPLFAAIPVAIVAVDIQHWLDLVAKLLEQSLRSGDESSW